MDLFLLTAAATAAATQSMPIALALLMVALGFAYVSFITFLQRRFLTNPARIAELQLKISAVSSEMRAMAKKGLDVREKQKELMPHMKESTKMQMKSMFIVLPLSALVYFVALPTLFAGSSSYVLNFVVPMSYLAVFFWTALVSGLVLSTTLMRRDRRRAKERMALTQNAVNV